MRLTRFAAAWVAAFLLLAAAPALAQTARRALAGARQRRRAHLGRRATACCRWW